MKTQIKLFFTAMMFYTRVPCPKWVDHEAGALNRSTVYFPLIGWLVGLVSGGVYWAASEVWSDAIAIIFAMISSVWMTGAFHEDGFADTCDGFGGGWTKEKILMIMKDSRIGTYGAVGLVLLLLMKFFALDAFTALQNMEVLLVFVVGHSLSRFIAATTIYTHEYARDDATSKVKPVAKQLGIAQLLYMAFWGILPVVLFSFITEKPLFLIVIPMYLMKVYLVRLYQKWIDGYTGDGLGAIQQLTEVVAYLAMIGVWRYFS